MQEQLIVHASMDLSIPFLDGYLLYCIPHSKTGRDGEICCLLWWAGFCFGGWGSALVDLWTCFGRIADFINSSLSLDMLFCLYLARGSLERQLISDMPYVCQCCLFLFSAQMVMGCVNTRPGGFP